MLISNRLFKQVVDKLISTRSLPLQRDIVLLTLATIENDPTIEVFSEEVRTMFEEKIQSSIEVGKASAALRGKKVLPEKTTSAQYKSYPFPGFNFKIKNKNKCSTCESIINPGCPAFQWKRDIDEKEVWFYYCPEEKCFPKETASKMLKDRKYLSFKKEKESIFKEENGKYPSDDFEGK